MKVSELRKLIGKQVKASRLSPHYIYPPKTYTVLGVEGRNLYVDHYGMTDWLWIPDYHFKPVQEEDQLPPPG